MRICGRSARLEENLDFCGQPHVDLARRSDKHVYREAGVDVIINADRHVPCNTRKVRSEGLSAGDSICSNCRASRRAADAVPR